MLNIGKPRKFMQFENLWEKRWNRLLGIILWSISGINRLGVAIVKSYQGPHGIYRKYHMVLIDEGIIAFLHLSMIKMFIINEVILSFFIRKWKDTITSLIANLYHWGAQLRNRYVDIIYYWFEEITLQISFPTGFYLFHSELIIRCKNCQELYFV